MGTAAAAAAAGTTTPTKGTNAAAPASQRSHQASHTQEAIASSSGNTIQKGKASTASTSVEPPMMRTNPSAPKDTNLQYKYPSSPGKKRSGTGMHTMIEDAVVA